MPQNARHTVYLFGYQSQAPQRLLERTQRLGAVLVDIRHRRQSRQPGWDEADLRRLFHQHYLTLPQLGNRNYRGGTIKLAAPKIGIRTLLALAEESPLILLCVCAPGKPCHRYVVADILRTLGVSCEELMLTAEPLPAVVEPAPVTAPPPLTAGLDFGEPVGRLPAAAPMPDIPWGGR